MYTIITDSCSDLNPTLAKGFERFEILPMTYTLSGEMSTKPFDTEETVHAYYDRLRSGEMCTTAQVSPGEFADAFRRHAQKGEQVLALIFSSALSGTYTSACMAKEIVLEEFPEAVIEVVDTLSASAGQGLLVYDVVSRRDAGVPIEENAKWARENVQSYVHWFTVDDLHFLKRGGRCSPSAAFFGSMLNIKPVLHVDSLGRLIARSKVRGRKQALRALAAKFGELATQKDQIIFISHGDCTADAEFLKNELVSAYGAKAEKIILSNIGPVIGSHSGPGTVALFFRGRDRG